MKRGASLVKYGILSTLLSFSACNKDSENNLPAPSFFSKTEVSDYVTKLPDGSTRIDYSRLTGEPWQEYAIYGNLDHNAQKNEKDFLFWATKGNFIKSRSSLFSRWNIRAFQGQFFQKTNFYDKNISQTDRMNSQDGVPEIFIVPTYKRDSQEKLFNEPDIRARLQNTSFDGFVSYVFVDKDYLKEIKSPKLYFSQNKFLKFLKNLDFKREKDIFFTKIETTDHFIQYGQNKIYCLKSDFMKDKWGLVGGFDIESPTPFFILGNFNDDSPMLESEKLNSQLYTFFGVFNKDIIDNAPPLKISEAGGMDKIISECFNKNVQEKFTMLYESAKIENPTNPVIYPESYNGCKYAPFPNRRSLMFDPDGTLEFSILHEKDSPLLVIAKKSEAGWEIKNRFQYNN